MEQINQILGNNLLFIIAVLLVLIVFLLVMLVNMNSKLRKLQWKYDYFTKGTTMDWTKYLLRRWKMCAVRKQNNSFGKEP